MVYFVGAGSGAVDLITVRGQRLLRQADVVIYAGSLVNPQLLKETLSLIHIWNNDGSRGTRRSRIDDPQGGASD